MTVLTATLHVCSKHKPCVVKCNESERGGGERGDEINGDIQKETRNEKRKDINHKPCLPHVVEWQVELVTGDL